MRIYLDTCCLQRPSDDQTQLKIKIETEAILAVLAAVEAGDVSLLSSEALEYEVSRIPDTDRRNEVLAVLDLANEHIELSDEAETLAESLEGAGVQSIDTVHLALASTVKTDFFCTCDNKLLHKGRIISGLTCQIVSPPLT